MHWLWGERPSWATLRAQLTLWNTIVVLLMATTTLVAVVIAARGALYRETDATLLGTAREVGIAVSHLYPDTDALIAELQRKETGHTERGWFTHLLTRDGTTLWKSDRCPQAVADYPPQPGDRRVKVVQLGPYRYVRLAIDVPDSQPLHIRIGISTAMIEESIRTLLKLLIPAAAVLSLLTPLAAYWLAGRATRPVADILETAQRLRPTRLGDRLTVSGSGDELDRLSITINRLLDRVAEHVERQERFVADAAHELRGPLAAIQNSIEVTLAHDRDAPEYRETLIDVLESTRHLTKLANDLLMLAESSDASAPRVREPVQLAVVAAQAVAMFEGVADERRVILDMEAGPQPTVSGEAGRLRQVIGNLLDNALRFTPAGGRVTVSVNAAGSVAQLTVRDTGPGIPAGDLDRIFDRFAVVDPARSPADRTRSGGLGLSICKSLVDACGGSIGIASPPGEGTTVTVRLPIWKQARDTGTRVRDPAPA